MRLMPQGRIGLAAAIADCRGGFAADCGGDGIDAETAFAGEPVAFADLRKGREHQQPARRTGVKVGAAGLEVGAKAAWHDHDERMVGFAHGAGDRLFARRDAARDDDTAACAEEQRLVDFVFNVDGAGAARDLNEHLVGRFEKKGIADGVDGLAQRAPCVVCRAKRTPRVVCCAKHTPCAVCRAKRTPRAVCRAKRTPCAVSWRRGCARQDFGEGDCATDLEKIGVLHNGPATRGIALHIANHGAKLALSEENGIIETGKPKGCRAIDLERRGKGEIGLGAGDLETSDDLTQRRIEPFTHTDDAVEMLGHDGEWTGFDFGEHGAEVLPSAGDRFAQGRGHEGPVSNLAQNRPAPFYDERNHVEPRLAVIPARQPNAGLEMPVLVALANGWLRSHVAGIVVKDGKTVNVRWEI